MFKRLSSFIACIILCFIFVSNTFAASLGSIPYWDADYNDIGRWDSARKTYNIILGSSSFTPTDFSNYVSHARTQWNNSGITISQATSETNANIRFYGGNFAALSLYNYNIQSWMAGYTEIIQKQYEGEWNYLGFPKYGYIYSEAECYVVYSSGKTDTHYKHVATHELGHGLGWVGHSSNSSDVMYPTVNNVTSLTTVDKRHIGQIY